MTFAVVDNKVASIEKTKTWFKSNYPNSKCLFATNGAQWLHQLTKERELPTIVFIDIDLPIMDGCTTTYYLKKYNPAIKVIGFSTITDYEMIRQAFISGVDGFIWKNELTVVLKDAIATVLAGKEYLDKRFKNTNIDAAFLKIIIHRETFWEEKQNNNLFGSEEKNTTITNREKQFLILATSAMSYKDISNIMLIEEKSVQNMANKLCKKLGLQNIKELVLFALKHGISVQANFMFLDRKCLL